MRLTPELARELFSYDEKSGDLTWRLRPVRPFDSKSPAAAKRWNTIFAGKPALTHVNKHGRKSGTVFNCFASAAQVCWMVYYGHEPQGQIDHIDGNPSNDSIANLRDVTPTENLRNRKLLRSNTSGTPGVVKSGNGWAARIGENGGWKHLGTFRSKDEAIAVRRRAEREMGYSLRHGVEA